MCLIMQSLVVFAALWTSGFGFTCVDENNNAVDWYSVYKTPKIYESSDMKIREGLAHFYLDVNSPVWTLSASGMNEPQQAVYETLSAFYNSQSEDTMFMMYNDDPPESDQVSNSRGHTKGVVVFDKTSGFWLVHSVPHFPPIRGSGYDWPKTALEYGQTFLCVTFPYSELGKIATQLLYNQPTVYDSYVPASIAQDFPVINDVINEKMPPGLSNVVQITSLNGQVFTHFAKSGQFGADLYDSLVALILKQDLQVETWLNGKGGKMGSNCSAEYKVMKITRVSLPSVAASIVSFNETKDHSKWAVSYSNTQKHGKQVYNFQVLEKWTCVGDINRMHSQFSRGGGTLCLQNSSVWETFKNSVAGFDSC